MTTVSVEYFGMPGTGRTVTEAKQDAGRRIETLLSNIGQPTLLQHRGRLAIVFCGKYGWEYGIMDSDFSRKSDYCTLSGGFEDRYAAELAARVHLAQNGHQYGETTSDMLTPDARFGGRIGKDLAKAATEFASWAEFQNRYHEAKQRGMSDMECHNYAGRNPATPELWRVAA